MLFRVLDWAGMRRQSRMSGDSGGEPLNLLTVIDQLLPKNGKTRGVILLVVGSFFGLVGPWCVNGVLASFQERAAFPMLQQEIEWTRQASASIPCDSRVLAYAPIISSLTIFNQRIVHERETQQHLYSRFFSPRSWLQVRPIPIPCQKEAP